MAVTKPQDEQLDQYTSELVETACKTVAEEIAQLKAKGIPIYYHETLDGPLIQESPDGSKAIIAPANDE